MYIHVLSFTRTHTHSLSRVLSFARSLSFLFSLSQSLSLNLSLSAPLSLSLSRPLSRSYELPPLTHTDGSKEDRGAKCGSSYGITCAALSTTTWQSFTH